MYRGLYSDDYTLFQNNTPPETATGLPFGVFTFSDERDKFFSSEKNKQRNASSVRERKKKFPPVFTTLIDLRCKINSFSTETSGLQASVLVKRIADEMFKSTPINPSFPTKAVIDALVALSRESDEETVKQLSNVVNKHLLNFPFIEVASKLRKDSVKRKALH